MNSVPLIVNTENLKPETNQTILLTSKEDYSCCEFGGRCFEEKEEERRGGR